MTWILLNKRWSVIILLCIAFIAQLAYTNHLAGKLNKAESKCASEKQSIIDAQKAVHDKWQNEINRLGDLYEQEQAKEKVVYNQERKVIEKIIVDNPVYRDCKLTDDGLSSVRKAISSS